MVLYELRGFAKTNRESLVNPQITSLLHSRYKTGVLLPHIYIQSEIYNHQTDWVAGFGGGKQKHIIWGGLMLALGNPQATTRKFNMN